MRRIIKITESQLREAEGDAFKYLDTTDDTNPFNGQSAITAQGKLNGEENGEPIFTDRIGKQRTPQSWARYRMYGNLSRRPYATNEGVSLTNGQQNDSDNDKIDDMYTNVASLGSGNGVETLSDGTKEDNLCAIPYGVDYISDNLIKAIRQHDLNPKQIAMVLDKLQEAFPEIGENSEIVKSLLRQQIDPNNIKDFD